MTRAPQLLPLTVYLAAALGVVAVVGLVRVGWGAGATQARRVG